MQYILHMGKKKLLYMHGGLGIVKIVPRVNVKLQLVNFTFLLQISSLLLFEILAHCVNIGQSIMNFYVRFNF